MRRFVIALFMSSLLTLAASAGAQTVNMEGPIARSASGIDFPQMRQTHDENAAKVGAIIGLGAGAVVGVRFVQTQCGNSPNCTRDSVLGAMYFGALGAGIGALIGADIDARRQRTSVVLIPPPSKGGRGAAVGVHRTW